MGVDRIVWKIILDIFVLVCVGLPLLALTQWATPYQRGFFESDLTIRLPFKEQSITEGVLGGVGFALIIITVVLTEIVRDKQGNGVGEKFFSGSLIPGWVWESYTTIGIFTFGAACQQLTSNTTKYVIGRLRPHFYDICRPVFNENAPNNVMGYIQEYTCVSTVPPARLKDIHLSFPSAHSSFAMYSAVFFIFYVQVKCKWRGSKLLRHGIQYVVLVAGWYVGLTRVQEHYHHWSDVAAGYLIGASYAALVFIFVLKPKKYGAPLPTTWEEPTAQNVLPRPVLAR